MRIENNILIIEKERSESLLLSLKLNNDSINWSDFTRIKCEVKELRSIGSPSLFTPAITVVDDRLTLFIPTPVMEKFPNHVCFDIKCENSEMILTVMQGEINISNNVTRMS